MAAKARTPPLAPLPPRAPATDRAIQVDGPSIERTRTRDFAPVVPVNDFSRYLHLHRVRTVLQLIEPFAVRDHDFPIEEIVNDLREVPNIAHHYAGERDRYAELPPWDYGLQVAVRHAHFHEMTRSEVHDIIKDATGILRHGYRNFIRAPDHASSAYRSTGSEPRWFWRAI